MPFLKLNSLSTVNMVWLLCDLGVLLFMCCSCVTSNHTRPSVTYNSCQPQINCAFVFILQWLILHATEMYMYCVYSVTIPLCERMVSYFCILLNRPWCRWNMLHAVYENADYHHICCSCHCLSDRNNLCNQLFASFQQQETNISQYISGSQCHCGLWLL